MKALIACSLLFTLSHALRECVDSKRGCAQMGSPFCVKASLGGDRTVTANGRTCQLWSETTPHKHNYGRLGGDNVCRNPDGDDGPWCYTTDPKVRWEFCYPPCKECYNAEKECVNFGTVSCTIPSAYSGQRNTTHTGKSCQMWSSQSPNVHQFGTLGENNFCSNPNGRDGPWCFVDDEENPGVIWEYCFKDCSGCLCPDSKTFGPEEDFGEIVSPLSIDGFCPGDTACKWRIEPGNEGTGIALYFKFFRTQPEFLDIVYIRPDGKRIYVDRKEFANDASDKPDYVFDGSGAVELSYNARDRPQRGFHLSFLRFDLAEAECSCPLQFLDVEDDSEKVILMSPGYPKTTCVLAECRYYLRAVNKSQSVRINFGDLDLNSTGDAISIYEGNRTIPTTHVRRFNGSNTAPITYTSAGPELLMIYRVGPDSDSKGFAARASQVVGPCQKCENQSLTAQGGWFASPGYPETYCPEQECFYQIKLPSTYVAQLKFEELDSVPSGRIVIANSTGSYQDPLVFFYQNNTRLANRPFTVDDSIVNIRYKTHDFHVAKGFNLTYKAVKRNKGCSCPKPTRIYETKGEIEIPACGPLDCFVSLIRPSEVTEVYVWIDRFEVADSEADYLALLNHPYSNAQSSPPSVAKMYKTGLVPSNETRETVRISGPAGVFHFHSSGAADSQNGGGIKLRYRWNIQDCGRGQIAINATHPRGNLTSPEFPDVYGHNLRCQWILRAPIGFRVVVQLHSLHTESYDKLSIYDAAFPSENALLRQVSGEQTEGFRLAGNGTVLTIAFTSDSSVSDKGWNLTYFMEPNVRAPAKCSDEAKAILKVQERLFEKMAQEYAKEYEGIVDVESIKARSAGLFDCSKLLTASIKTAAGAPVPVLREEDEEETETELETAEPGESSETSEEFSRKD